MWKIRFYYHPIIYVFMNYFVVSRSNYRTKESTTHLAFTVNFLEENFNFFSFLVTRNSLPLISNVYMANLLVYRHYYRYYIYFVFNTFNVNGWALRYSRPSNLLFLVVMIKSLDKRTRIKQYNVNKINDFYTYLHSTKKKFTLDFGLHKKSSNWLFKRALLLKQQTYFRYNRLYTSRFNTEFTFNPNIILIPLSVPNNVRFFFKVSEKWVLRLKAKFPVKFGVSNITKNIKYKSLKKFIVYYIRKNKVFNKSRYSRNRQLYRTGFYWCLWLNIMVVYGLYFFFYRFSFSFGYLGLGLIVLALSFVFARACQSKFYNPKNLWLEFLALFNWAFYLSFLIYNFVYSYFLKLLNYFILNFYAEKQLNQVLTAFITEKIYSYIMFLQYKTQLKRYEHFYYIWIPFQGEDTSFLKWRSIVHWFTQLYKMLRS